MTSKTFIEAYPTKSIKVERLQSFLPYSWLSAVDPCNLQEGTFTSVTLDEDSPEFRELANQVLQSNPRVKKITCIDQVENPFLYLMFLVKRHENYREYICQEVCCYHGTHKKNVDSILNNNLNWRYYGKAVGYVHGRGVYFSKKPAVAAHYANNFGDQGCLLVAKVLVASMAAGSRDTSLPPEYYDTTGVGDDILVKYADNEFYTEFIVYFTPQIIKK